MKSDWDSRGEAVKPADEPLVADIRGEAVKPAFLMTKMRTNNLKKSILVLMNSLTNLKSNIQMKN